MMVDYSPNRSHLPSQRQNVVEVKQKLGVYKMLVHCCLVEQQYTKAFEYAAMSKGQAFVNNLTEARLYSSNLEGRVSNFAQKLAQIRQLRGQIEDFEFYHHLDQDEKQVLLSQEAELWRKIERHYPLLSATLTVPTLSAENAQHLAQKWHVTLVEYYRHGPEGTPGWCAFVIRQDGDEKKPVQYIALPRVTSDLLDKMIEWRNELHLPAGRNSFLHRGLEQLYEAAIAPLELKDDDERVVIAPFDQLHLVPLSTAYNRESKRYLAQEHTLSFVPSLTALYVINQEKKRRQGSEKSVERLLSVAYPGTPASLNYLPNVLEEAQAIVQRLPNMATKTSKKIIVQPLHEDEATPDKVIEQAPDYDMIHFACHGRFDFDKPEESGLRLAGQNQDAYLTVQRIMSELNLKQTRLVTLAACLTGEVKLQEGEEHIGLLQAMMTAGTQTVVASLWRVDDAATRSLFEAFYFREVQLHSPAQAMKEASDLLRQKKGWNHPYYWAAFQVNGLTSYAKDRAEIEWPAELLADIEQDNESSMQRGVSMDDKLIIDNAKVLLKTMVEFRDEILPALQQHPLSENVAQQELVINPLNVAKALHYIVQDNPILRDAFPDTQMGKIRVTAEQHQKSEPSLSFDEEVKPVINTVNEVKKELTPILKSEYDPTSAKKPRQQGFLAFLIETLLRRA